MDIQRCLGCFAGSYSLVAACLLQRLGLASNTGSGSCVLDLTVNYYGLLNWTCGVAQDIIEDILLQ